MALKRSGVRIPSAPPKVSTGRILNIKLRTDVENQPEEFRYLLEELRKQLLEASVYFDIWEQIWPTEKVVRVINQYRGFFLPTRKALFDQFSIKICNVTGNDHRLPSFYKIFKILEISPSLAPKVNVQSLRKRLKKHRAVLTAINSYRNTKAAHWDTTNLVAERKPVLFGDSKRMLKELQDIFNKICGAATNGVWSFEPLEHSDANSLLNQLNELRIMNKKRIEELRSTIKS